MYENRKFLFEFFSKHTKKHAIVYTLYVKKNSLDRTHIIMYSNVIERETPLNVVFYETQQRSQPCRDFLLTLVKDDRREVGADIFAAQKGFPLGLPLCRKMGKDLWEIRSTVSDGICRIFFTVDGDTMILLHGFNKKSDKTPLKEISIGKTRLKDYKERQK